MTFHQQIWSLLWLFVLDRCLIGTDLNISPDIHLCLLTLTMLSGILLLTPPPLDSLKAPVTSGQTAHYSMPSLASMRQCQDCSDMRHVFSLEGSGLPCLPQGDTGE